MKAIAFLLFFIVSVSSHGQLLFKVITLRGSATIDGKPVRVPLNVYGSSGKLTITSRDGAVGIITSEGFAYVLEESMPTNDINAFVKEKVDVVRAVHRGPCCPMSLPLSGYSPDHTKIVGDTLFAFWTGFPTQSNMFSPPPDVHDFVVRFKDLNGDLIATYKASTNWRLVNIEAIKRDYENFYLDVITPSAPPERRWSRTAEVTSASNEEIKKVKNDRAVYATDPDKLFYECAYNHLSNLNYDELHSIYRILSQKKKATDPLLQKFFDWLTQEYDLHYIKIN